MLRPSGTATDTFQEGKTYKFSVEMPDIGKVCESYVIYYNIVTYLQLILYMYTCSATYLVCLHVSILNFYPSVEISSSSRFLF